MARGMGCPSKRGKPAAYAKTPRRRAEGKTPEANLLRLLRRAIQYREEIQADQVNDALLLRQRALAPQLVAEHARRGQLGREAAPSRRAAFRDGFRGEEVAGFRVDGSRGAHAQ